MIDRCNGSPMRTPRLANGCHFGLTFVDNGKGLGLTLRDKGSQTARSAHARSWWTLAAAVGSCLAGRGGQGAQGG